jgi:hypothetical protein
MHTRKQSGHKKGGHKKAGRAGVCMLER